MEQLSEKLYDFLARIPKSYYLPILLSMSGLVLLVFGMIQLFNSTKVNNTQVNSNIVNKPSVSVNPILSIQVDVEGAVVRPGVYKLPQNARVQDGLIAAGGLSADADRIVVAKSLNLAAKLTDGVKIYVPKVGETAVAASGDTSGSTAVLGSATGLVNINSATESQLDDLPGIGPVTAQKIISGRPYGDITDLTTKKILSSSVFTKIKDKITIY